MNPLTVACPTCDAVIQEPCLAMPDGVFHDQRIDLVYMLNEDDKPMPKEMLDRLAEDLVG